ncbi:general substrate transporter [Aspergillus foveolatus]|uniref:general substrate transporter n=1 Tax=Aspergillus foveolatus TaxID=210207 RepID=UPI003CCDE61B
MPFSLPSFTAAHGPYIWSAAFWASYCGGLHGFNTANISGAMSLDPFVRDFGWTHLTDAQVSDNSGWAVSSMLLRRGRKSVILLCPILYTIGAVLMAGNIGSFAELLVGRVLSGLGSGCGMTAGPVYISEIAPRELRGMMTTFYNVNIMGGVAGSYWINYASLQTARYLLMRGRVDVARSSLLRLRGGLDEQDPYVAREYAELQSMTEVRAENKRGLDALRSLVKGCSQDSAARHLPVFVVLIQTFFIMSGGNSITYYAPTILKSIGLADDQVLLFTAIYGLIKIIWRRPLLLIGSTINVLCLLYLSVSIGVANIFSTASPSPAAWVAIVAICIFAVGYGFGWAPVFSLTASEICPTHLRGPIVAFAFTYQNLLNFGISRGFPNITEDMHAWGPFALFAAFTACGTAWSYVAFPECKGRSMENVGTNFSLPWYRTGFSKVPDHPEREVNDGDLEKSGVSSIHQENTLKS